MRCPTCRTLISEAMQQAGFCSVCGTELAAQVDGDHGVQEDREEAATRAADEPDPSAWERTPAASAPQALPDSSRVTSSSQLRDAEGVGALARASEPADSTKAVDIRSQLRRQAAAGIKGTTQGALLVYCSSAMRSDEVTIYPEVYRPGAGSQIRPVERRQFGSVPFYVAVFRKLRPQDYDVLSRTMPATRVSVLAGDVTELDWE